MNQQQRKYATERVAAIKTVRTRQLTDAFNALSRPVTTTGLIEAVRIFGGDFVKKETTIGPYTDVGDVFDLRLLTGPTEEERLAHVQALAALETEAATVKDQIMLGDAEEALRILAAFAEGRA